MSGRLIACGVTNHKTYNHGTHGTSRITPHRIQVNRVAGGACSKCSVVTNTVSMPPFPNHGTHGTSRKRPHHAQVNRVAGEACSVSSVPFVGRILCVTAPLRSLFCVFRVFCGLYSSRLCASRAITRTVRDSAAPSRKAGGRHRRGRARRGIPTPSRGGRPSRVPPLRGSCCIRR